MIHNEKQQLNTDKTLRDNPTIGSAGSQRILQRTPARAERIERFTRNSEPSISYIKRSYRVGDLLRGLPTAWNHNGLVLIVRSSGHPSYFYGIDCLTGEEHLFNLEHYVGVDET